MIDSDTRTVVVNPELVKRLHEGERLPWRESGAEGAFRFGGGTFERLKIRSFAWDEALYYWAAPYDPDFLGYMAGCCRLSLVEKWDSSPDVFRRRPAAAFGLQHLVFCERQWGLIHIEQIWSENRLRQKGANCTTGSHEAGSESRPGLRVARGLRMRSLRLGVSGQADVVEFRASPAGVPLPGEDGLWLPFPVDTNGGGPSRIAATWSSCAPRPCAWKRCSGRRSRRARFSMALRSGADVAFAGPARRNRSAGGAHARLVPRARDAPRRVFPEMREMLAAGLLHAQEPGRRARWLGI